MQFLRIKFECKRKSSTLPTYHLGAEDSVRQLTGKATLIHYRCSKVILLTTALLAVHSNSASAQSEAAALFLTLPPGSRANAMGSAHTAVADDFYGLYFNPAGIAQLEKGSVGIFHHNFAGIIQAPITFTGGVYKTEWGSWGFAFNNIDLDTPIGGGGFNAYERTFQLTYANQIDKHLSLGGTVKLLQGEFEQPQGLDDASSSTFGFDAGILVQDIWPHLTYSRRSDVPKIVRKLDRESFRGFSFGLALLNTGPDRVSFIDEGQADPLPQMLRLGVAFNAVDTDEVGLLLAFDLDKVLVDREASGEAKGFVESWFTSWDDGFDHIRFGMELNIYHILAVRFGRDEFLNFSPSNSVGDWTFGFGLGPEWARLNLVRRSFPTGLKNDKWVLDLVLSY